MKKILSRANSGQTIGDTAILMSVAYDFSRLLGGRTFTNASDRGLQASP